ncbi:DedA family protein [Bosea sp. 2KB_26]|uniref:DedA family protein n=1 Tax=Bosea sp. 2KB_26 TaxID=3237475 RepID=UPI000DE3D85D
MAAILAELRDLSAALLAFVQEHRQWTVPLAFMLAFVKSLPFFPLIVPGTALLLAIGSLIGASGIGFIPVWIAISVGAALGDWVSYWLGRNFASAVRSSRFVARHPGLLPRGEAFFNRWGALSIVLCRFFGPLRATVPFVAGVCAMPRTIFQIANWASAFLWAGMLLLPGALAMTFLIGR